jgi:protein-S-isoprenylcysteine O-methyltransferase Ste14
MIDLADAPRHRPSRNGAVTVSRRLESGKVPKSPGSIWLGFANRLLTGGFFAFCAVTYLKDAVVKVFGMDFGRPTLELSAVIVSMLAITFFMGLVAWLYAVQLPPLREFAGWRPALAAGLGTFAMFGLLLLKPCEHLPPGLRLLSAGLISAGSLFAVWSLRYLDRSFSILPQARQLVTGGPYRIIRHPIYLAEAISVVGALLNFLSIEALALFAAQLTCQLLRMNYEEQVLGAAFPEYAEYSRRTARLLPGVYWHPISLKPGTCSCHREFRTGR